MKGEPIIGPTSPKTICCQTWRMPRILEGLKLGFQKMNLEHDARLRFAVELICYRFIFEQSKFVLGKCPGQLSEIRSPGRCGRELRPSGGVRVLSRVCLYEQGSTALNKKSEWTFCCTECASTGSAPVTGKVGLATQS